MTAIVLTLISVPSAQASGATDTQLPGRVTAKVAPEHNNDLALGLNLGGDAHVSDFGTYETRAAGVTGSTPGRNPAGRGSNPRQPTSSVTAMTRRHVGKDVLQRCRSARIAAVYFRFRTWTHQELRDGRLASKSPIVAGKSCHWAKFAAREWEARARSARRSFYRWLRSRFTLREYPYTGKYDPWPANVAEVQRVFPDSADWILSCSDAEGWEPGRTEWVLYGWKPYYPGAENDYIVGGPGQFKYPTFTGMFRRGLDYLRSKGYRVPSHLRQPGVAAWRSPLGQAIAMGAAVTLGLRASHWSASYGDGCEY